MNQFRRAKLFAGFALALAMTLSWQQASGAKADSASEWKAPLEAPLELIRPYRQPNSDYSAGHRGVDYRVTMGQAIFSPVSGVIHFSGFLVNRPVMSIKAKNGDLIAFEPACTTLIPGDEVRSGDQIGLVCQGGQTYTNHCTADNCLHFSLRTERGYLSPIVRYGALSPSVLLPHL